MTPEQYRASEGADIPEYVAWHPDEGRGAVIIAYLAVAVIAGLIGFGVGLWVQ